MLGMDLMKEWRRWCSTPPMPCRSPAGAPTAPMAAASRPPRWPARGMALGIAGLFLEAHPDPAQAKCDGPCALPLDALKPYLEQMLAIDRVVKSLPALVIE